MAFALGYGTMPDHIVYGLAERNAEELIRRCHNEILSELSFNPKEEKDKKP